jgi:DNA-binding SARP family transcriptional activator/predicted ATPase
VSVPNGVSETVSELKIVLLGAPRIELAGEPVDMDRRKATALLAYLAMTRERHRRESLAAFFWPEYDRSRAYAYLRRTLWEINNALGEGWLDVDREEVGLSLNADIWLDVAAFLDVLVSCAQHDHAAAETCSDCIAILAEAIDLYRGDFLAGFGLRDSPAFDEWQFFEAERLRQSFADVLRKLVEAYSACGEFGLAIEHARRWLSLDQFNEVAHRQLMQLYAWNGQRSAALRQYYKCVRILEEELGVAPEPETTRLTERIEKGEVGRRDVGTDEAAAATVAVPVSGRPTADARPFRRSVSDIEVIARSTPFVGRWTELEEIAALLEDSACRLLTLLGPGGVGKTRLAVQVALEQQALFPHGVYFVPLAPLRSAHSIVPAIADAVGLEDGASQKSLGDALVDRQLLLVMDNFEHLIEGAGLMNELAASAPSIKILVTSRERLRLRGEWVMEVGGMAFPTTVAQEAIEGFSAIELFVQSARRSRVDFDPEPAEYLAIARIAQLVQGMPLALELAAAWVGVLSCQEIADEIEEGLDVLASTLADLPERQRSIRAVFDYSWDRLEEGERESFPGLSVFRGGFSRSAAEEVAGVSLRGLMGLVGQSLLQRTGEGRFEMHELLRQYAAERLAEEPDAAEAAHDRHCAHFCAALSRWGEMLKGPHQQQAMAEMVADLENIQAAWDWAVSRRQIERLDHMAEPMALFYRRQLRLEEAEAAYGAAVAELAPVTDGDSQRVVAAIMGWQAWFNAAQANYEASERLYRQGQALLDASGLHPDAVRAESAFFAMALGQITLHKEGDFEAAKELLERSVTLFQEAGDPWWENLAVVELGGVFWYQDPKLFKHYIVKHLERSKARGDQFSVASSLQTLGVLAAYDWGDMAQAEYFFQESCRIFEKLDEPICLVAALSCQEALLNINGRFAELLELRKQQLETAEERGNRMGVFDMHMLIGETYHMLGRYEEAESHGRLAVELAGDLAFEFDVAWARWFLGLTLLGAGKVAEARGVFLECLLVFQEGGKAGFTARTLAGLSRAELALGNRAKAWKHALHSLALNDEVPDFISLLYTLAVMALLLIDVGEMERAVEVYGLVSRYRFAANSLWFEQVFGQYVEAGAAHLSAEAETAARDRGAALDPWQAAKRLREDAQEWEKEVGT